MQTSPEPIAALGTPPSSAVPTTFATLADALLSAFPTLVTQINAAILNCYNNAVDCYNNAVATLSNKNAVDSNTALVQAAASGGVWVSGAAYTAGDTRWSPANGRIYRRKTTSSAGTTDPSVDTTNWLFISPIMRQVTEARATVAIATGVVALDLMNGVTSVALNANVTSITFANNIATATEVQCHTLEFVADGTARTVAWPNGNGTSTLLVKFVGGTTPTLTATSGKRDTFFLKSVSQFLWECYVSGQNT